MLLFPGLSIHQEGSSFSRNFHFMRNLNYRETFNLITLMSLLDSVTISLVSDRYTWSLDSPRSYTCKPFFDFLVKSPSNQFMPFTISFWKIRFLPRLEFLFKLLFLTGLIPMIYLKCIGFIRLYLNMSVMCRQSSETNNHLFLNFVMVWEL